MEGDTVKILTQETERGGAPEYEMEISEKPMYMLNEEYNSTLIICTIKMLKMVCETIYPGNKEAQSNCIKGIMNKVLEQI